MHKKCSNVKVVEQILLDITTLCNMYGDGNCLFRAFSYIITGSENQHLEVCDALLSYMLSIENLLVGW